MQIVLTLLVIPVEQTWKVDTNKLPYIFFPSQADFPTFSLGAFVKVKSGKRAFSIFTHKTGSSANTQQQNY